VVAPGLSEIIDRRLVSTASLIEPTEDEPVLTVDVLGRFAAVYRLSVGRVSTSAASLSDEAGIGRRSPAAAATASAGRRRGGHPTTDGLGRHGPFRISTKM
jgi:hypothetical protein